MNVAISEFYEWGTLVPDAVRLWPADGVYPGGIGPARWPIVARVRPEECAPRRLSQGPVTIAVMDTAEEGEMKPTEVNLVLNGPT